MHASSSAAAHWMALRPNFEKRRARHLVAHRSGRVGGRLNEMSVERAPRNCPCVENVRACVRLGSVRECAKTTKSDRWL